jgi:serine O-acetyltransferase
MPLQETLVYKSKLPIVGAGASFVLRVFGINIPSTVKVGPGPQLPHGAVGVVVHERSEIGANVKLFQGVTLGRGDTYLPTEKTAEGGNIVVGDDVVIGANATVLFKAGRQLRIGRGAVIGANSVVLEDVPGNEIWAGNPARRVKSRNR